MTGFEAFQLGQFVVTVVGAILLWSSRGAFQISSLLARLESLETRMNNAGQEMSDLSDKIQIFPLIDHRIRECEKRLDNHDSRLERRERRA